METHETFGDRLKALRTERSLLQSEFGEIIGERMGTKRISPSAVGSYERNEREPAYALLREFADFFGVSLDYLLCRSDERLTVEEYLKADTMELKKALEDLTLTMNGEPISYREKKRIYDIAFSLLWRG
jgi:transcriptional regulator with XRE-family HTH domain